MKVTLFINRLAFVTRIEESLYALKRSYANASSWSLVLLIEGESLQKSQAGEQ